MDSVSQNIENNPNITGFKRPLNHDMPVFYRGFVDVNIGNVNVTINNNRPSSFREQLFEEAKHKVSDKFQIEKLKLNAETCPKSVSGVSLLKEFLLLKMIKIVKIVTIVLR